MRRATRFPARAHSIIGGERERRSIERRSGVSLQWPQPEACPHVERRYSREGDAPLSPSPWRDARIEWRPQLLPVIDSWQTTAKGAGSRRVRASFSVSKCDVCYENDAILKIMVVNNSDFFANLWLDAFYMRQKKVHVLFTVLSSRKKKKSF